LGVILTNCWSGRLPYRFAGGFIDAVNVIQGTTPERLGDIDRRLRGDLGTSSIGRSRRNDSTGIRPRKSSPTIFSV
jgi:hypothetical protein